MVPLAWLRPGESAEILQVTGDADVVASLAERGLRPGGRVEAIQQGEPAVVLVDGARLTLRTEGRADVWVRPETILPRGAQ